MTSRRSGLKHLLFVLAMAGAPVGSALAQANPPAIDGYDPVAYFTEKQAVRGNPAISQDFDDRRYLFSSSKHRELFAANPDRYLPQFNGLCAGNVSKGNKVKADPTIWRIVDGKLYLFAGPQGSDGAVAERVAAAEAQWKAIK